MISIIIAIGVSLGISLLLGIMLSLADRFLKVEEDPRFDKVNSLLAGANCGGCGYPGCSGYAQAIVEGKVQDLNACRVTKLDKKQEMMDYLASTPGPDGKSITLK